MKTTVKRRLLRVFAKPVPIRVALALLAVVVMLPSLIFFALEYRKAIADKQAGIERDGRSLARSMKFDIEREIAIKKSQLNALAGSGSLRAGNYLRFGAHAQRVTERKPEWIAVLAADGSEMFDTHGPLGLTQTDGAQLVREVSASGRCAASDLFEPALRAPEIAVVCPIAGTDRFIAGNLPLSRLSESLRREIPQGWLGTILDRSGRIIARSLAAEETRGTLVRPAFWNRLQSSPDGWMAARSIENIESFVSWHRLDNGWTALVAMPRAIIEAPMHEWQHDLLWSLIVFSGLAFVSAVLVGEWINRSLQVLTKAAASVGAGQTSIPCKSSIREVNDIGKALAEASEDRRKGELANAHLAALVTSSGDSIMSIALDGTILTWNSASEQLYGYRAGEAIGMPLARLMPPERMGEIEEKVSAARAGRNLRLETVRQCRDGKRVEVSLDAAPIRSSNGSVVGISVIAHDITRRKKNEAHIEFVMRELSHRTKNLITVIIAVARRTARQSGDLADFEAKFSGRLHGLARSHDLLVHTDWTGASIEELVRLQLSPFVGDSAILDAAGPHLVLRPEAVQNLGFALHELATNAHKYGGLSRAGGSVAIRWSVEREDGASYVHLAWREHGGPPVAPPERTGFGTTVICQLTEASLSAKVKMAFEPDGFLWEIDMPAHEVLIDKAALSPPGAGGAAAS